MEYLLLALDFREILFLLARFGPLQAALLEVFEPGCDGGALGGARGVTAVLWEPTGEGEVVQLDLHTTQFKPGF